jgi:hypothetical protein
MRGGVVLIRSGGQGREKEDRCPNFHGSKNQSVLKKNGKREEKNVRDETSLDDGLNYTAGSSRSRYDHAVFRRRVGLAHRAGDFISNLTFAAKGFFKRNCIRFR